MQGHAQGQARTPYASPGEEDSNQASQRPPSPSSQAHSEAEEYPESPSAVPSRGAWHSKHSKCRLFVRCAPQLSMSELARMFEVYGPLDELKIVIDRLTRKSKGMAFVKFISSDYAETARQHRHGTVVGNRMMYVQHALKQSVQDNEETDFPANSRLYVTCPKSYVDVDLHRVFCQFGDIEHITVLVDSENRPRGCSFIKFSTAFEARQACSGVNGLGYPVQARVAQPRAHRGITVETIPGSSSTLSFRRTSSSMANVPEAISGDFRLPSHRGSSAGIHDILASSQHPHSHTPSPSSMEMPVQQHIYPPVPPHMQYTGPHHASASHSFHRASSPPSPDNSTASSASHVSPVPAAAHHYNQPYPSPSASSGPNMMMGLPFPQTPTAGTPTLSASSSTGSLVPYLPAGGLPPQQPSPPSPLTPSQPFSHSPYVDHSARAPYPSDTHTPLPRDLPTHFAPPPVHSHMESHTTPDVMAEVPPYSSYGRSVPTPQSVDPRAHLYPGSMATSPSSPLPPAISFAPPTPAPYAASDHYAGYGYPSHHQYPQHHQHANVEAPQYAHHHHSHHHSMPQHHQQYHQQAPSQIPNPKPSSARVRRSGSGSQTYEPYPQQAQ